MAQHSCEQIMKSVPARVLAKQHHPNGKES